MALSPDLALGYHLLSSKNEPQEILPGLFLGKSIFNFYWVSGSARCAAEVERLKTQIGITHILSVGGPTSYPDVSLICLVVIVQDFISKQLLDVDDLPSSNIFQYFDECVSFIEDARQSGKILVHCHHGVSRSATVVIVWSIILH